MRARSAVLLGAAAFGFLVILPAQRVAACATPASRHPTPTPLWAGLLQRTPIPVATPLPRSEVTIVDGVYTRDDPSRPHWWACRRCADYRSTGGIWRLQLDRGIARILHDTTGWRSLASYAVDGDRLVLFNDPVCPWDSGTYLWDQSEGALVLRAVDDPCAFGLRAENLTRQPWSDCRPPDARAAASDSWNRPAECDPPRSLPIAEEPPPADLIVEVFPGDVRQRPAPPRIMVAANLPADAVREGLHLESAPEVIPYGVNLILWRGGDWIEWTLNVPATSVGVQFWGPESMGAARMLIDGREVWRGVTADLGEFMGQYGGYVKAAGLAEGRHRVRVEHLQLDARPVNVLLLGLD